ncbi:MAG: gliding motility-associated C-terminal domain-containing protein, partial [Opitutaceae bacterium]|nr:gliding motility-associated C-terminal domain-containing protein [Cytophagales bacterium]
TFNWFKLPDLTTPLAGSGQNKTTLLVSDTGRYVVRVTSPTDATCFKESAITNVTYLCERPVIQLFLDGKALSKPYNISLCEGQSKNLSIAPQKYTFEYDIRKPDKTLLNSVSFPAGDSAKLVLTSDYPGTFYLNIYSKLQSGGARACWTKADSLANPLNITVSSPVAIITTPAPYTYCPGTNGLTLTAQNAGQGSTYLWNLNGQALGTATTSNTKPNALAGDWSVTVTDANNCKATSSPVVKVTPSNPAFNINRTTSDTVLCTGDVLNLFNQQNVSVTWVAPDNANQAGVSYSSASPLNGKYKAIYTVGSCTVKDSVLVKINPLPVASITNNNPTYCPSVNGTSLTALDAGQGAIYEWSKDGSPAGSASSSNIYQNALVGAYSVKVTMLGCSNTSSPVSVSQSSNLSLNISGDTTLCTGDKLSLTADQPTGVTWTLPDKSKVSSSVLNIDSPLTGIYKADFVGSGGCKGSDSVFVSNNAKPLAILNPVSGSYCSKESGITLTASSGLGMKYVWYKNNVSQGPATTSNIFDNALAGNWTVEFISAAGCSDTLKTPVTVTLKPTPVAEISTQNPTYCPSENGTTLSAVNAGNGATYEWFKGPVNSGNPSTSLNFDNATVGIYTLKVTLNGCDSTSAPVEVKQTASSSLTISGDTILCTGDILLLETNQANNITWTLPDKSQVGTVKLSKSNPTDGYYKAEHSANGSCKSNDSVFVKINQLPIAEIMPGDISYCPGQNGTILVAKDAGNGSVYGWFKDDKLIYTGLTLSGATEGDYYVKVSIGKCSQSSAVTTVTQGSALLVAIKVPQTTYCKGDPGVTLTAAMSNNGGYVYEWFKDNVSVAKGTKDSELPNASQGLYKLKVTSAACSGESDTLRITEADVIFTELKFDPTTPTDTCLNSVITIKTIGTPGTIEWTENNVSKGIHTDYTFTLTQTTVITANLTSTLSCAVPKTTGPREITIKASQATSPTVAIKRDQPSVKDCEGEQTIISLSDSSQAGPNPSFQWFVDGTPKPGETNPNGISMQNWVNNTVVELQMTKTDGCVAPGKNPAKSNPVILTGNPSTRIDLQITSITDNTVNGFLCPGDVAKLKVITNIQDPNMTYFWRNKTSSSFFDPAFSHSVTETTFDSISVSIPGCFIGKTSAAAGKVIQIAKPDSIIINNNINGNYSSPVCLGDTVLFTATGSKNVKTFTWFKNGQILPSQGKSVEVLDLKDSDEILVEGTSDLSCSVKAKDSTIVKVDAKPLVGFENGAGPLSICQGEVVKLVSVEKNPGLTYSWTKDQTPKDSSTNTYTASESGVYLLKTTNGSCSVTSTIDIKQAGLSVKVSAEPLEFLAGEIVQLKSVTSQTENQILTYSWTPSEIMFDKNAANTGSLPIKTGFVKVTVTNSSGCIARDSIELKKKDKLFIPNALIPGTNDQNAFWGIKGTENYPHIDIKVFNRWGTLVHEQTGYSKPWDGTINGKDLPTGTYYYVIRDNSFEKPFVGDLTIVR